MKKVFLLTILSLLFCIQSYSQGLFENAQDTKTTDVSYQLNGYVRGTYYAGEPLSNSKWGTQSAYGEAMLKLNAKKGDLGEAFAEFRIRNGVEYETDFTSIDLREAYVSIYPGKFDIRLGKQIIAWGKADGINPTNNITPQNLFSRPSNHSFLLLWRNLRQKYANEMPFYEDRFEYYPD